MKPQSHAEAGKREWDIDRRPCSPFATGPAAGIAGDGIRSGFGRQATKARIVGYASGFPFPSNRRGQGSMKDFGPT